MSLHSSTKAKLQLTNKPNKYKMVTIETIYFH